MRRVLFVDESLNKRLGYELDQRGRPALTPGQAGTLGLLDNAVLDRLHVLEAAKPLVLVTSDDAMPWEWEAHITALGTTIATVHGEWEAICRGRGVELTFEEFRRDTVHRWAHVMAEQEACTVRRYTPWTNTKWIPRLKHRSMPQNPLAVPPGR